MPADIVLGSYDFVRLISAFQRGVHGDMRSFVVFAAFPASVWAAIPASELSLMDRLLQPWYKRHGITRLALLFDDLRYMVNICLLHAVHFGYADVLRRIHEHTRLHWFGYPLMEMAAIAGHTACVRFLSETTRRRCTRHAMYHAVRQGNVDLVTFLLATQDELGRAALDLAAQSGHLDLVEYLHAYGVPCTTRAIDAAAANGHLAIVQFLHFHRQEGCTTDAMDAAAANGHIKVVQFLHMYRTEGWTVAGRAAAAENGHHHIVAFLSDARSTSVRVGLANQTACRV
ncbi:Aste57867_310 [Aphanomyces stellatus]|uniref:Aste57867_310 protein n=1 Tax=Aphanomyces stellatus TaxID=120398 RepID=A0A485K5D7_9STRA|nr:hypothetical protein As57867_000310 [Aphanomyces stellatus]VFT77536.1 Aste57867_310 [Aphanomyces stellatus]